MINCYVTLTENELCYKNPVNPVKFWLLPHPNTK